MARRDVEEYYNVMCDQYSEMIESLHDIEEAVSTQMMSPDRLDEIKKLIEPIKENYLRVSYIMFLLNKPTKFQAFVDKVLNKFHIETKTRTLSKRIDKTATLDAVKEENKKLIDDIKM